MFNFFSSKTKAYKDSRGEEFKGELEKTNGILIDVRTAGEFASGTVSGAKNIDVMSPNFKSAINKLDKNREYFLFCRSGNRSGSAASLFEKLGLKSYNLVGGIGSWPAS